MSLKSSNRCSLIRLAPVSLLISIPSSTTHWLLSPDVFQPVKSSPLKSSMGSPHCTPPVLTRYGALTPVKLNVFPLLVVIVPLIPSPANCPSIVNNPPPPSHCGGIWNENTPSFKVMCETGRLLPASATKAPTSTSKPESLTSSQEGTCLPSLSTVISHRPINPSASSGTTCVAALWISSSCFCMLFPLLHEISPAVNKHINGL